MPVAPKLGTLQSDQIVPLEIKDGMEKGPLQMGHTSVSYGSLGAVEEAGLVILEVDHAETFAYLLELLQMWLKQNKH